ncbi:hypothetical protein D3C87_2139420 [compost metagenome]
MVGHAEDEHGREPQQVEVCVDRPQIADPRGLEGHRETQDDPEAEVDEAGSHEPDRFETHGRITCAISS